MRQIIKIDGHEIVAERKGNELSWPFIHDALAAVGLEIFLSESGVFMDEFNRQEYEEITTWAAMWTDIDVDEAKKRLTRFIHILGIAEVITSETTDEKLMAWVNWISNVHSFVYNSVTSFTYSDLKVMVKSNGISCELFEHELHGKINETRERVVTQVQTYLTK